MSCKIKFEDSYYTEEEINTMTNKGAFDFTPSVPKYNKQKTKRENLAALKEVGALPNSKARLQYIYDNTKNTYVKNMLGHTLKQLKKHGVTVNMIHTRIDRDAPNSVKAGYNVYSQTADGKGGETELIQVNLLQSYKMANQAGLRYADKVALSFVHEANHALFHPIRVDNKMLSKLKQLHEKLMIAQFTNPYVDPMRGDTYIVDNLAEFMTEGVSNPHFIAYLDTIPYNDGTSNKSIGKRLLEVFMEYVLGVKVNPNKQTIYTHLMKNYILHNQDGVNRKIKRKSSNMISGETHIEGRDYIIDEDEGVYKGLLGKLKGKIYQRVTDLDKGFLSNFSLFKRDNSKSWMEKRADRYWEAKDIDGKIEYNIPKDTKQPIQGNEYTYDEYLASLENTNRVAALRGDVVHKIMEVEFGALGKDGLHQLRQLYDESGLTPAFFTWIGENKVRIAERLGLNLYDANKDHRDVVESEKTIFSDVLGIAGTIDMLVKKASGLYSIIDFKAGKNLYRNYTNELLKYGQQISLITDNPIDRGKLQVMTYAFMFKAQNPEAQFDDLMIAWMASEKSFFGNRGLAKINPKDYLKLIELHLKNEKPDIYAKLLETSPKIFDPNEYSMGYSTETRKEILNSHGGSTLKRKKFVEARIKELMAIAASDEEFHNDFIAAQDAQSRRERGENVKFDIKTERTREIFQLYEKLTKLQKLTLDDGSAFADDMSTASLWLSNNLDVAHPMVKFFDKRFKEAKKTFEEEHTKEYNRFLGYLTPVWQEYAKRKNLGTVLGVKLPLTDGKFNGTVYSDLWDFAFVKNPDGTVQRLKATEEEMSELSKAERNFLKYLNAFYNRKLLDPNAYYNKKDLLDKEGNKISPMQLRNKLADGVDFVKQKNDGFFPKVPQTMAEVREYSHIFTKKYWKVFYQRNFTNFIEFNYEKWDNVNELIPIKYVSDLPNSSLSLEHGFEQFLRSALYKEHMDTPFAIAKAVQHYAKLKSTTREGDNFDNVAEYVKVQIEQLMLGRKQVAFKGGLTRNNAEKRDYIKIIEALMNWFTAPIMWLKPVSGLGKNGPMTGLIVAKNAMIGSIIQRFDILGVSNNVVDFGLENLKTGLTAYLNLVGAKTTETHFSNKHWLLMKHLRAFPDSFSYKMVDQSLLTARFKGMDAGMLYMFHSIPEEAFNTIVLFAQMDHAKMTTPVGEKSLLDMYHVVDNDEGVAELKWGYKNAEGKIISHKRGVENVSSDPSLPEYQDVTELTSDEMENMKFTYQKMLGAYKNEEKAYFKYFIMGRVFGQFKTYVTSQLKNGFQSRGTRAGGQYQPMMKDGKPFLLDGETVLEWHERVSSGRFPLLMRTTLAWFGFKFRNENPKNGFQKFKNYLAGDKGLDEYRWEELSDEERRIILDTIFTWGSLLLMYGSYALMFSDADDEDSFKQLYKRIIDEYGAEYFVHGYLDQIGNVTPASGRMLFRAMDGIASIGVASMYYVAGNEEKAFTQEGNFRGLIETGNTLPFAASFRDVFRFLENTDVFDDISLSDRL